MLGFRGGLAFGLRELGRFQAARGVCDGYSGRFDINSTLILPCPSQIRHDFDTILTFLLLISGSSSLHDETITGAREKALKTLLKLV